MAWKKVPQENAEAFREALPQIPNVELRKMFGCPAGFINGNMFCGAHEENILVRLPPEEREAALKQPGFSRFAPMGREMREYVCLPEDSTTDVGYLARWFEKSAAYTSTLPPKEKKPRKTKAAKK